MAVLLEALSLITKKESIESRFPGGFERFYENVPTPGTFCEDEELTRVGFMGPDQEINKYVQWLLTNNLQFYEHGEFKDFAIVDQSTQKMFNGITRDGIEIQQCRWLELIEFRWPKKGEFPVIFDQPSCSILGLQIPQKELSPVAVPDGWVYEGSLSDPEHTTFTPNEEVTTKLKFLRQRDDGLYVYLDTKTGKTMYSTSPPDYMDSLDSEH
tara:strand:+ start:203 stop:838 length:636 start_codon:yes stop_codon:yes gene_type:complete